MCAIMVSLSVRSGQTQGCDIPGKIWEMAFAGGHSVSGEVQMPMSLPSSTRTGSSGPAETPSCQRNVMHMLMCSFVAYTLPSCSGDRGNNFSHAGLDECLDIGASTNSRCYL